MGSFRIGRNFYDLYPTDAACAPGRWGIHLEETDVFAPNEYIYAVYETGCDGSLTYDAPFVWSKSSDGITWTEIYRYNPPKQYLQFVYSDIFNQGSGYFKVEYYSFLKTFRTNDVPGCTPNWQCELPLNGYEHDVNNCGQPRRLNPACNASLKYRCTGSPNYSCIQDPIGAYNSISECQASCKASMGDACMKSNPGGATIIVDGTAQAGKTTAVSTSACVASNIVTGLTVGSHSFKFTLAGYQDVVGNFTVAAGQVVNVDAGALVLLLRVSPCPPLGDILGDGFVGQDDADAMIQYMSGQRTFTPDQIYRASLNTIAGVDVGDLLLINQFIAGVINTFPACNASLKYRCTGSPNYSCIQDPIGAYNSISECQASCKAPTNGGSTTPASQGSNTGAIIIGVAVLATLAAMVMLKKSGGR